jgi:hypothetical protein
MQPDTIPAFGSTSKNSTKLFKNYRQKIWINGKLDRIVRYAKLKPWLRHKRHQVFIALNQFIFGNLLIKINRIVLWTIIDNHNIIKYKFGSLDFLSNQSDQNPYSKLE